MNAPFQRLSRRTLPDGALATETGQNVRFLFWWVFRFSSLQTVPGHFVRFCLHAGLHKEERIVTEDGIDSYPLHTGVGARSVHRPGVHFEVRVVRRGDECRGATPVLGMDGPSAGVNGCPNGAARRKGGR